MKKESSPNEEIISAIIGEIVAKKKCYNDRMLQTKKVTKQLLLGFNELKTTIQEIILLVDSLASNKNEESNSHKNLLTKFQQAKISLENIYVINVEHNINLDNLEYFRKEIAEDILKLQQHIMPNLLDVAELGSFSSI